MNVVFIFLHRRSAYTQVHKEVRSWESLSENKCGGDWKWSPRRDQRCVQGRWNLLSASVGSGMGIKNGWDLLSYFLVLDRIVWALWFFTKSLISIVSAPWSVFQTPQGILSLPTEVLVQSRVLFSLCEKNAVWSSDGVNSSAHKFSRPVCTEVGTLLLTCASNLDLLSSLSQCSRVFSY